MDEKFTLSQIGLYNTQRVSDTLSRKLFVVRQKQFDLLMDSLQRTKEEDSPQHHLIIGQRGMGKTTLLKRIEVELRSVPWKERFIPLLFPEEQYNVRSLSEFWLNCIDAMADVMDMEHDKEMADEIDTVVAHLMEIEEEENRSREANGFLVAAAHKLNRRPVLLIDNISLVFNRLNEKEHHMLRSYMAQAGAPIIVGGNPIVMEAVNDYRAPFYDAFRIHYLDKLKMEELIEILVNLASLLGEPGLLPEIQQHTSRIKALHQLTGGNPRTAVMLFRLIVKGFSNDINEDLEALLDEATPLYKARFEELSSQMQIIVDAIAMNWDPITLERLREITRFENPQISPQLKRLTDLGWIEKPASLQGKGGAYEMSERMFNIWFLMRRSSRRQKRGVFCLSKFMEAYYGENIEEVVKKCLAHTLTSPTHIMEALAAAKLTLDPHMKEQLYSKSRETLFDLSQSTPEIIEMFEKTDIFGEDGEDDIASLLHEYEREKEKRHWHAVNILLDKLIDMVSDDPGKQALLFQSKGRNYMDLQQPEKSDSCLKKSQSLNPQDENTYLLLAILYHDFYKDLEQTERFCKEAVRINPGRDISYYFLGKLYGNEFNQWQKAEEMYLLALQKAPDDSDSSFALAKLYAANNQEEKAEKIYLDLLKTIPENDKVFIELGNLYNRRKGYEQAEKMYLKGIELNPKNEIGYYNLAGVYKELKRYKEAEKLYLKVIDLSPSDLDAYHRLGYIYFTKKQYPKAEALYLKAIEHNPSSSQAYLALALFYDETDKTDEAEEMYLKVIEIDPLDAETHYSLALLYKKQNRYEEAGKFFKRVTELDPQQQNGWFGLAVVQYNMAQYEEAEKNYKIALGINPKEATLLFSLGMLYERQGRYREAEKTYRKSVIQKPSLIAYWSLADLYKLYLNEYKKAEKHYLKAIDLDDNARWVIRKDLADLYENYSNDNEKAVDMYQGAIALTSDPEPKYLLARLYRDRMADLEKAEKIFGEIGEEERETDRYQLNLALFELYKKNKGLASEYLKNALNALPDTLTTEKMYLWIYFAKIVLRMQEASWLTERLEEEGFHILLAPYYHAIKLFTKKNPESYLDTIAKEIRDIAQEMVQKMK